MGRAPLLRHPLSRIDVRIGQEERDALVEVVEHTGETVSGLVRRLLLEERERVHDCASRGSLGSEEATEWRSG